MALFSFVNFGQINRLMSLQQRQHLRNATSNVSLCYGIAHRSLCLPAIKRKTHIGQLYNCLDFPKHSFSPFSSLHCVSEARGRLRRAGASWNALTSEGSWTHARMYVHARARDVPSYSVLCECVSSGGAGARSHSSRLWDELRQAVMRKVCAHMDREHGVW